MSLRLFDGQLENVLLLLDALHALRHMYLVYQALAIVCLLLVLLPRSAEIFRQVSVAQRTITCFESTCEKLLSESVQSETP